MKTKAVLLMIACTVFTALGQVFYKLSAPKLQISLEGLLFNYYLIIGLFFYFIGAVLLILALKHGELSKVYPIISLTFVWVLFLGLFLFGESLSILKLAGTSSIILGVALLSIK